MTISSPFLARPRAGRRALVAGVLSGTSADGIDVALVEPVATSPGPGESRRLTKVLPVAFETVPFDESLLGRVRDVLDGGSPTLAELAALDRDLGLAFGAAVRRVQDSGDHGDVVLVASHGQTVFHHDGDTKVGRVTLQLGDGDWIAEAAGAPVVSDFRTRDCAAGGEGAPLVALVDDVLFHAAPRPLAILNLGGMGNWTLLSAAGADPRGFDTGPAGALLDGLARRVLGSSYDEGGRAAARGRADEARVADELEHPYFARTGPRSTGRDTFGEAWVDRFVGRAGDARPEDLLATGCRFVAESVARSLAAALTEVPAGPWTVAVAGGGLHNKALMRSLESALGAELGPALASVASSDALGVPPDGREAQGFAALGARLALGEPSTSPGVTGAPRGRILGKWSAGPPGAAESPLDR